jgi:cell division protein FtsZ
LEGQTENKSESTPDTFIEISTSADQIPTTHLVEFIEEETNLPVEESTERITVSLDQSIPVISVTPTSTSTSENTSGVVLSKPKQIYVEEEKNDSITNQVSNLSDDTSLKPEASKVSFQFMDEVEEEMILVEKTVEDPSSETEVNEFVADNNTMSDANMPIDETAELRRRANERLNKLRNLSFNTGNDPNSEFETVPAYMRRGMDVQVQLADVESFYSHYTVKSTPEQPIEVSRINKFLDGKKPD